METKEVLQHNSCFFQTLFFIQEGFLFNNKKVKRINLPVTILIKNFERCPDVSRRFIFHHFLLHHHLFNVFHTGRPQKKLATEFWWLDWETKFLNQSGPSRLYWTVWINLGHFGLLWPKILVSQHGSQNSVSNFFGTPCTSYCVIIIVPLFLEHCRSNKNRKGCVLLANRKRFIRNSPRIPGILCFLSRLRQP